MAVTLSRNDVVARAKELKHVPTWLPTFEILGHWVLIVAAIGAFYVYRTWWVFILVVLAVSALQYGLAILMHDAQHTLLHPNKRINGLVGTWLIAGPIGTDLARSQKEHLDHHFHFGVPERDPDYGLYCFGPPSPKQTNWQVTVLFLLKLMGSKALTLLKKSEAPLTQGAGSEQGSFAAAPRSLVNRLANMARQLWPVIVAHSVLLIVLTWSFGWYGYIALWALPLATMACFYNDFRVFCEHSLIGRDTVRNEERLTSFVSSPLERFFIAPNHMNFHAEHHMFPYVPHRNLPALREAIRACPELNERIEWRGSYFGHLVAYLKGARLAAQGPAFAERAAAPPAPLQRT